MFILKNSYSRCSGALLHLLSFIVSSIAVKMCVCLFFSLLSSDDMKRIKYCRNICLCLEARHKQVERKNVVMANEELVGMEQRKKNRARLICHAYNLAFVQRVFSL